MAEGRVAELLFEAHLFGEKLVFTAGKNGDFIVEGVGEIQAAQVSLVCS